MQQYTDSTTESALSGEIPVAKPKRSVGEIRPCLMASAAEGGHNIVGGVSVS